MNVVPSLRGAARNLLSSWAHKVLSAVASVVLTGWATRVFGLEQVGILVVATSIAAYLMLLDLGTSSSLPRVLPKFLAAGDRSGCNELLSTAVALLVPICVVAVLVSPGIAYAALQLGGIPQELQETAFWVICVSAVAASLMVPARLGFGILGAISRFDVYFMYETLGVAIKLALAGVVLTTSLALPWYAAALALPPLLVSMAELRRARTLLGAMHIDISLVRRSHAQLLLNVCGASILMTFAAATTVQGGALVISVLGTPEQVALFAFPLLLATTAMSFTGSFGAFLAPIASALNISDTARMRSIIVDSVRISAALAGLIALVVLVVGPAMLPIWLGEAAMSGTGLSLMTSLLWIFGVGFATYVPGSALKGLLLSVGNPWTVAVLEALVAMVALAVGSGLYLWLDIGQVALGCAVAVGLALRGLFLFPWLSARLLQEPFWHFFASLYARPTLVVGCVTVSSIAFGWAWRVPSASQLVATIVVLTCLWLAGCYLIILPPHLKKRLEAFWRHRGTAP